MLQLYYSFIYPYLHYCNLSWGNAPDIILWPVLKNQKIALRIISNTPRRSSTLPYCKKHSILRLPEIYQNSVGIFMYKYQSGLLPEIFNDFFSKNHDFHSHLTRNAAKFRPPLNITQHGVRNNKNYGSLLLEFIGKQNLETSKNWNF